MNKHKLTFYIHHSTFIILVMLSLSACSFGNNQQMATTFEQPTWSPDGTQVAYIKRHLTTKFVNNMQQLEIVSDAWELCVNDAAGNAERVIVPDSAMYHPTPDQNVYETIRNEYRLTWRDDGKLVYYVYARSLLVSGLPPLTGGVYAVNPDGSDNKLIAKGVDMDATLKQFDNRRISFGDKTLYGQGDSPPASRAIMLADDKEKSVSVYLQDPLVERVTIPTYEDLVTRIVDAKSSPTP